MFELCAPALIYLFFSITQILIDLYLGLYNTVVIKIIVMITITLLLNILCQQNLGIISWIIVFIPFIFLTTIVSIVLYIFGMNIAQGKIQKQTYNPPPETIVQPNELILEKLYPKHGITKYLHIPISLVSTSNDSSANICDTLSKTTQVPVPAPLQKPYKSPPPFGSSSPEYESFISY